MARITIITGAASGIGRALASALVVRGDAVVVADVDVDGAERAAGELARHGPGAATPAVVDVCDAGAVQSLVDQARDKHGQLDPRVTCANAAPQSGGADDQPNFVIVSTGGNDTAPDLFQRRAS